MQPALVDVITNHEVLTLCNGILRAIIWSAKSQCISF